MPAKCRFRRRAQILYELSAPVISVWSKLYLVFRMITMLYPTYSLISVRKESHPALFFSIIIHHHSSLLSLSPPIKPVPSSLCTNPWHEPGTNSRMHECVVRCEGCEDRGVSGKRSYQTLEQNNE